MSIFDKFNSLGTSANSQINLQPEPLYQDGSLTSDLRAKHMARNTVLEYIFRHLPLSFTTQEFVTAWEEYAEAHSLSEMVKYPQFAKFAVASGFLERKELQEKVQRITDGSNMKYRLWEKKADKENNAV